VLFILAVIVSGTLNCIENIQRTRRFTRQLTESASKVATETFERCDINALLDNPDSEEYRKAVKTLRWICQTNHLEYMYIYIPNFDENKVTYVMTVADDDSENENALNVRSAGAEVDHSLWDAEKEAWENPNLVTAYEYQNDSFGSFYTAFSAIQGKDGKPVALIGADYSLTQIYTEIIFYTAMRVLALFVVLAIVFLLVMRFVRKKMYNPILLIFEKIRGYFSDKADGTNTRKAFVPIKLGSDDEIQLLADYFNDMAHDVETYVEKNSALASEKAKNETELEVARRIQYGIIAREKNVVFADCFDVSARMESARQVGGDFYDCFALPDGRICAVVGDVSGKGVAAAMFMAFAKTLIHEKMTENAEPDRAFEEINRELCSSNPEGMFVTAFAVIFDKNSDSFLYINAGHNKPVAVSNGKAEFLECKPCIMLGVFDDARYVVNSAEFGNGDIICLYTDGVNEATNADNEFFGNERLVSACQNAEQTAKGVCDGVYDALTDFTENAEQFDDITIVAIKNSKNRD
jgi:sigma-B regulation protein RsbU (phosphoserine phosphatase)